MFATTSLAIDTSTWYYTLSTLAQVLAAVLGLASIFVVLKFEYILKNINDFRSRGLEFLGTWDDDYSQYEEQSSDSILKSLEQRTDAAFQPLNVSLKTNLFNVVLAFQKGGGVITVAQYQPSYDVHVLHFRDTTIRNLKKYISQKNNLITRTKPVGVLVVLTIIISMLALAFTDHLSPIWAMIILAVIVSCGVISLVAVALTASSILKWNEE